MKQYLNLLDDIKENGILKHNRTGIDSISVFGRMLKFDLQEGFPCITIRKIFFKGIISELLWFLNAIPDEYKQLNITNIKYLVDNNVNIWNEWCFDNYLKLNNLNLERYSKEWFSKLEEFRINVKNSFDFANKWGDLGPVYHKQWLSWGNKKINQIDIIQNKLRINPDDRRLVVSAWNVDDLDEMLLQPCHYSFQFYSSLNKNNERMLSLLFNMRSCDCPLGLPYNISSYAYLLSMMAQTTNHIVGNLNVVLGDTHIYINQLDGINEQLKREPKKLPILKINKNVNNIFDFRINDFEIQNYESHPIIKMPIAV
jgi:thymidylate synthase